MSELYLKSHLRKYIYSLINVDSLCKEGIIFDACFEEAYTL